MRKLIFGAAICALASLCVLSCQKEVENVLVAPTEEAIPSKSILEFKSQKEYMATLESFNQQTDEDFLKWEKMQGIKTAYSFYNDVMDDFAEVTTEDELQAFFQKYEGKIRVNADDELEVINYNPFDAKLLNVNSEVLIGGKLHVYHANNLIIMPDASRENLETAIRLADRTLTEPVFQDGIYVKPYRGLQSASRSCPNHIILGSGGWCTNGNFRTKGDFEMRHNGSWNGVYYNDLNSSLSCFMHSQKKSWGIWGAHRTPITWFIDWDAYSAYLGSQSGYQGWTGPSTQSQITYNQVISAWYDNVTFSDADLYWYNFTNVSADASTADANCPNYSCP